MTAIEGSTNPEGHAGIYLVQQKVATALNGALGVTVTFDTPIRPGSTVLASIANPGVLDIEPTLVGGGAEVLIRDWGSDNSFPRVWAAYRHNVAGGETGITYKLNSAERTLINVSEWRGLGDVARFAQHVGEGTDGSPVIIIDAWSPGQAQYLAYIAVDFETAVYSSGPTGGFTRMLSANAGGLWMETAYLITPSNTSVSPGWTLNTAPSNWGSVGVVYGGLAAL